MPPYDIQPTPNPNSLKFTPTEGQFDVAGMISASTVDEAAGNVLAARLCSIDGITNVFILPQFLTVTKDTHVEWDDIMAAVEKAVSGDAT